MEKTIEANQTSDVVTGNNGNNVNTELISSNGAPLQEAALYPNKDSDVGNRWEQEDSAIDLAPENPPIPDRLKVIDVDGGKITASGQWAYRNGKGEVLGYIQRFDVSPTQKEFRPLTLQPTKNGMEWKHKALDEPRPLYGLERLFANPEAEVIVCEGEKAADAAARLFPDKVTVTSMNGAKSPEKSDWGVLAERTVYLWADNDEPGGSYIAAVEKLAITAEAKVTNTIRPGWFLQMSDELGIEREQLPIGWDAADAEREGFTAINIQTFLQQEIKQKTEHSLFGQTPRQRALLHEEISQSNEDLDKEVKEKQAQSRELFKDSEFAVLENRKGFKNGVYWQEPYGENGLPKHPIYLCSPLIIVAETRDIDQSNWGRLLSWQDNDKHEHKWACPSELLAATDSTEFRRELVRNGLTIATNNKVRQKLVDYIQGYPPKSQDRVRCVTKTGWYGKRYVLSSQVYGKQEGESVIYQGATNGDFASAGTLADWQREISSRAAGNSRIVFAISIGFSGTLVAIANEPGGGFQYTSKTSHGKTTSIIDPSASIWGHPDRFSKKWRTTANGLEALCLSRNDSVLILDDLGQSDAKECGQAAYLVANGQGKARMQKEGGNRPLTTWNTMLLSSGEVDLSQHMAEAGKVPKGGQVVRLPSIPADAGAGMFVLECLHDQPDGRQFSDTMKAVTRQYYGTAGDAFLKKLTDPETLKETTESVRRSITEIVKRMKIPEGAAPEVGRVAARFALVAFSGELATSFGITGWDKGEALKATIRCFQDWLLDAGSSMGADDTALFSQVSSFLQAHGASRFPPRDISKDDLQRVQNRAGFSYISGENVSYMAESGAFKNLLCKGFNPTAAAKSLIKAGWLKPGQDRTQQKQRISALGGDPIAFYVFTSKALDGEL